jgi:formyltetrahydrofolate hydrolase
MESEAGAVPRGPAAPAARAWPDERYADVGRLVITGPDRPGIVAAVSRFLFEFTAPVINIHRSFLPAFAGADPYRRAAARGVRLIGATAHYVTAELDAGPIIEQDIVRVDHRSSADDLRRLGRHVERAGLAPAVAWHLEDRVIVHQNRTIVFS